MFVISCKYLFYFPCLKCSCFYVSFLIHLLSLLFYFFFFLHLNITAINCLSIIVANKKTERQTAGGLTKKEKAEEPIERERERAGEPRERESRGAGESRARNEIGKRGEK